MSYMQEPLKVKQVELKNRLVMPPMATSSTTDGTVNQKLLDYYQEKSAGGYIGFVIMCIRRGSPIQDKYPCRGTVISKA